MKNFHYFPFAFQHNIASSKCSNGIQELEISIRVRAPAIFVYIQIIHDDIDRFSATKNGFMQVDESETVGISFRNPNCRSQIQKEHISILTVNDFMVAP